MSGLHIDFSTNQKIRCLNGLLKSVGVKRIHEKKAFYVLFSLLYYSCLFRQVHEMIRHAISNSYTHTLLKQ